MHSRQLVGSQTSRRFAARMASVIAGLVLLSVAGWAQQQQIQIRAATPIGAPGANTAELTEEESATISGSVLGADGKVMDKATVLLLPGTVNLPAGISISNIRLPGMTSTSTDENGLFTLTKVPPGTYQLAVQRTGYVTQNYGANTPTAQGTPLEVAAKEKLTGLEVVMQPQGVIAGQVRDQDGEPVQGITVAAYQATFRNGRRNMQSIGNDVTDDEGNYRIPNLGPGRYIVSADRTLSAVGRQSEPQERVDVTTYYPSALDQRDAIPLNVEAGQQLLGTNIVLRRERVFSIRGIAIDAATRKPAANVRIMNMQNGDAISPNVINSGTQTAADGTFLLANLRPGNYNLAAAGGGVVMLSGNGGTLVMNMAAVAPGANATQSTSGRATVNLLDKDVEGVVFELTPGGTLEGTISLEGGGLDEYIPEAPTTPPNGLPFAAGPRLSVRLEPTQGLAVNMNPATVSRDGKLSVSGLTPGRYYLTVTGIPPDSGLYVKTIRLGGQDITHAPVDLLAGGGQLNIVLAKGATTATGTLTNDRGEPLPGVQVSLWPKPFNLGRADSGVRVVTTNQKGTFKLTGVTPGEYYAVAWETLPDPGLASYPEFLRRFESTATEAKLAPGAEQAIEVEMVPAARAARVYSELPN